MSDEEQQTPTKLLHTFSTLDASKEDEDEVQDTTDKGILEDSSEDDNAILVKGGDEGEDAGAKLAQRIRVGVCAISFVVGFILCFIEIGDSRKISQTLAIAIWMASLWLTELIPLVVTAFLPLFLFPMFGILSSATVASKYINNTIFLFISGFMAALVLERWALHRRFSLKFAVPSPRTSCWV